MKASWRYLVLGLAVLVLAGVAVIAGPLRASSGCDLRTGALPWPEMKLRDALKPEGVSRAVAESMAKSDGPPGDVVEARLANLTDPSQPLFDGRDVWVLRLVPSGYQPIGDDEANSRGTVTCAITVIDASDGSFLFAAETALAK